MCDQLEVSKSGYYDWYGRVPSKRTTANVTLLTQIEAAHAKSDATYGMPRIRAELADQGVVASRKRIASIMRKAHIRGVSRRRGYVVTTPPGQAPKASTGFGQTPVCGYRHKPALGGRHDLRADLGGFPVFGRRHRRVQPQARRLGVWCEHDG
jgi:hypothetical protein